MSTLSMKAESPADTAIEITPLQPAIGAEIGGVDVGQTLTEATRNTIYRALLKHKVIFFRNQNLTRDQYIAFGRSLGDLDIHPAHPFPEHPELMEVYSDGRVKEGADVWHTDRSYIERPPMATCLHGRIIPSIGGDTGFSNAVAAYEGLDSEVKARIASLSAMHDVRLGFKTYPKDHAQKVQPIADRFPPVAHPIVRFLPETGERALYVNSGYTTHIVGMAERESEELLGHLFDQFKRLEYQCRFHWAVDSIAMWDNRSAQHCAVHDYSEPRRLERFTICGDRPEMAT